ncbi:AtpZ/AtpI family protein [Pedobacter psychroterrae]|uniref:AtpZ/AtpI family protein n=1 Tax=Pedobacter psychroterrae TaxID=2530453 RepID=A0A4V2MLV4_9SPHI|nr:AtpZ/AtpI family protein [Pedobacter psychroterrae]TCD03527.1 AtpZ/AtpI family protein [Pedobacter psychroterrae]
MKDPNEKKRNIGSFARYSAISFQMLATIGLFAFGGYKLDKYMGHKTLLLTALLSLMGVVISLYQVVRQLNKNDNE